MGRRGGKKTARLLDELNSDYTKFRQDKLAKANEMRSYSTGEKQVSNLGSYCAESKTGA